MRRHCPGMDPGHFKPEDIALQPCSGCGASIEFWKDDVYLPCPACGERNTNARLKDTCLAWCKEAAACIGNQDIETWRQRNKAKQR